MRVEKNTKNKCNLTYNFSVRILPRLIGVSRSIVGEIREQQRKKKSQSIQTVVADDYHYYNITTVLIYYFIF